MRETEGSRLQPLAAGEAPPAMPSAAQHAPGTDPASGGKVLCWRLPGAHPDMTHALTSYQLHTTCR